MKYSRLGRAGIKVSQVTLGSNNFGVQVDEETTFRIIKKAVDCGINSIDTANIYTKGRSEELIGRAIRGYRDELVLATKVGWALGEQPNRSGLSRKHIMWQVRESLKRLETDYIDIYYLHKFDPETPLEETLRTMDSLVKDGKVRYVACSNFTLAQVQQAKEISQKFDLEQFVAVQPQYNLLQRQDERELLPYCEREGLAALTYSPLAGGFLTGKYKTKESPPAGSRAAANKAYWERITREGDFSALGRLLSVAERSKIPLHRLALAWVTKNTAVTSIVAGASGPEQVEEICQAVSADVPADAFMMLERATS